MVEGIVDIDNIIFAFVFVGFFIAMILYILFGQTTLRKLRKNPKTQHKNLPERAVEWARLLNIPLRGLVSKM